MVEAFRPREGEQAGGAGAQGGWARLEEVLCSEAEDWVGEAGP